MPDHKTGHNHQHNAGQNAGQGTGRKRNTQERRRAQRYGRFTETFAVLALRLKGYRIIDRNFRTKLGEIDVIARRGDLIAFVEVKARRDLNSAVEAVTWTAQQRIQRAANLWLARQRDAATLSLRFDIVAVIPRRWPIHLENAF